MRREGGAGVLSVVMTRYTVLRHDLPDGSWHFDWLLDPGGEGRDPEERRLIAFRTVERPDVTPGRSFGALRLADHRLLYLDFEGELPGGDRGAVRRISRGLCEIHVREAARLTVTLEPTDRAPVSLEGIAEPQRPDAEPSPWRFTAIAIAGRNEAPEQEWTAGPKN